MAIEDAAMFVGELTTVGRRTGLPRTVELRMVRLDGKLYVSSSAVAGKHWCRNMLRDPQVQVRAAGERFACRARLLEDAALRRRVLSLRDSPPLLERVVFELTPEKK
ncbi:MAG TPA: nitroreductase family deazaflavin-dependent oxidoreductase [Candidatus Binatia bacterium]|nr:nitroreductase family deazaflavin-dependent oxidoreductase [Candidatus Binatia bacterium]